jgi:hypothetical protein
MADSVDIAGANDFNEEKLALHRNRKATEIQRGHCLFCKAVVKPDETDPTKPLALWCDSDCQDDYEREALIRAKTQRLVNRNY